MFQHLEQGWCRTAIVAGGLALLTVATLLPSPLRAADIPTTNVNILVTDAETGQPITQARLTLQFEEQGRKVHVTPKIISLSAKTNIQGRYRFVGIPKGTIRVLVIADHHQTANKEFQVDRDNPLFEVKLRKPQDQV